MEKNNRIVACEITQGSHGKSFFRHTISCATTELLQRLFQAAKNLNTNLSFKFFPSDFTADVSNFDDISLRLNHVQVSVGYSSKITFLTPFQNAKYDATNFSMT